MVCRSHSSYRMTEILDWLHVHLDQYLHIFFFNPSLSQDDIMLVFHMSKIWMPERNEKKFETTVLNKDLCGHSSGVRSPTMAVISNIWRSGSSQLRMHHRRVFADPKWNRDSTWLKPDQICLGKERRPAACLLHALSKTFQTDLKNVATWDMLTYSCGIPINQLHICNLAGNSSVREVLLLRCIQSFWQL